MASDVEWLKSIVTNGADEEGIVFKLNSAAAYPVAIELPDEGPNGSTIKWFYKEASNDIIMDSSYVDDDDDGFDDDGILAFDDNANSCDFVATVSIGDVKEEVTFTVSWDDEGFTIEVAEEF